MDLDLLEQEIYTLISEGNEVYPNYLPLDDLNYLNNTYVTYSLDNIENLATYKDSILLELQVVSGLDNYTNVQSKAIELDSILKDKWIENCNSKIIRSNIYYMPLKDLEENKFIVTLNYKILKY